jgi:hypothetical protein
MAVYSNTNMALYVDGIVVSGFAKRVEHTATVDVLDVTTVDSVGWRKKVPGLGMHSLAVDGFADFDATTGLDPFLQGTGTGQNAVTFAPINGGAAIADVAYLFTGRTTSRTPLTGSVGEAAGFAALWAGDGRTVRGQVIHPVAARTTTANGTATTFTAPTATQSLWASFHVVSVSGAGTITFTVQTDDNAGMTTPTTRITSNGFTAVGGQVASLAGALTGETHIRVNWTIAGFTSVTFAVAAGTN